MFSIQTHIVVVYVVFWRCPIMGDIDDLIFGDEDNGPSDR